MSIDQNLLKVGGNSNPTGGENEPSVGTAIDNLLKNSDDSYFHLSSTYDPNQKQYGVIDGAGREGVYAVATDSIFNPFYLFRYAKYGNIAGPNGYSVEFHRDVKPVQANILNSTQSNAVSLITESKKRANNPTASQIIEWAASDGARKDGNTLGPTPYQWNDFLWCKWYGRIPNNRLLTLRRYPIPVEDNLQIARDKMPLIPIAQAVTWWGGDTGNSLENVLGLSYGFNWTSKDASVTDLTGNEIDPAKVLDSFGVGDSNIRKFLTATLFANSDNPYAGSGLDDQLQNWIKESYTKGAYWNRVLGPINVIQSTQIRDAGYKFTHNIQLKFSYKLRSFNNINPKIAMLDLITNFLGLTYNKAEFWGGSTRYFQKTGLIASGLPQSEFERADFIGGIKKAIEYLVQRGQGTASDLTKLVGAAVEGKTSVDETVAKIESSPSLRAATAAWVKNLIQGPLSIRALLDGRAVGEWHLTVGNPMDPIAVIGNLCLKNTKISFTDSLGLDDFPTEVNFTVTLEPGRARAKQDIESMFNAGGGDMSFTPLPLPSSAYNSYGERNSIIANALRAGNNEQANAKDPLTKAFASQVKIAEDAGKSTTANLKAPANIKDAQFTADFFKSTIARAYGANFAASEVLQDYFVQLKTKD